MARVTSSLERTLERLLWKFRLIAIVPVLMSLLGGATAFKPWPPCWGNLWGAWTCI